MEITLPPVVTVVSRKQELSVDISRLSPDIIARAAIHGLTQKIADAAANATKLAEDSDSTAEEIAVELMMKVRDALYAGEWSSRGAASGVDEETRVARSVVRAAVKDKFGAKSAEWTRFTGLSDDEQNAKLDANYRANVAVFGPIVAQRIAERRERSALADAATFAL